MAEHKLRIHRVTIESITRLNNSVNGNPRWAVTWDKSTDSVPNLVTRQTVSDASIGYEIGNPGYRAGSTVDLHLTRAGRIAYMTAVS